MKKKEEVLLDASALLALLRNEPGAEVVERHLGNSAILSAQLAEVVKKLVDVGADEDTCRERIEALFIPVCEEFSATQAFNTVRYCAPGLSLGDRMCLSAANWLKMPVLTADRRWSERAAERPDWNVVIHQIR